MFAEEEVRNRMGIVTFKTKEPRNIQDKGDQKYSGRRSLGTFRTKKTRNIQDEGA